MNISGRACLCVLFLFFTEKVCAGEAPEEEQLSGHVEDVPLRTHIPQNNAVPVYVQNMLPYPYNFYYPNPYALYSPQRSPYFQFSQNPAGIPLPLYPPNPAGYPYKMAQKVNGEEAAQDVGSHIPSQLHAPIHNTGLYHPSEITASDNSNLKHLLFQQPFQNSFFQSQSMSPANVTETPAVNVNSINLQGYKGPSFPNEKSSAIEITHNGAPFTSGINFEPSNLSSEKETRSLIKDSGTFETTGQAKHSINSEESRFLPMNSSNTGLSRSSEERHSQLKAGILPNFSNEAVIKASVSDSPGGEIILNNFSSTTYTPETKSQPAGSTLSGAILEKQIPVTEELSEVIPSLDGLRRKSLDVLKDTVSGSGQNKWPFETGEDIANTLVVQISTIYKDKSIEAPQVDPSGNTVLFPLSTLIQKGKNISSRPPQHHHGYSSHNKSVQNDNKNNSVLEQDGQKPTSSANDKNHQVGRRNKILDIISLTSKEQTDGSILPVPSVENESTKKQNKSQSVRARNKYIIIRLPSGQELVIDLSHSKPANKKGSSGSESDEAANERQLTQQTHPAENNYSEELLPGDVGSEEKALSTAGNDTDDEVPGVIPEDEAPGTAFTTFKYPSPEQSVHLSTFSNLDNIKENSVTDYTPDYAGEAKGLQNGDTKHVSYGDNSVMRYFPQRFSFPMPKDNMNLQYNMNPSIQLLSSSTNANTENLTTSPTASSDTKLEILQNIRNITNSFT